MDLIFIIAKFLAPRFTAAEVQETVAPLKARIAELESRLKLTAP